MTDPRTLARVDKRDLAARRRTAAWADETSDVRRFRGVYVAALVAAVAFAIGLWFAVEPAKERAPGPVSRPHARAGLQCASCHEGEQPQQRCGQCHEGHASARPGHTRLRASGQMGCTTCHAVHREMQGVTFEPDGTVVRWGTHGWNDVEAPVAFEGDATVPVVAVGVCEGCHDAHDPGDPIARCLMAEHASLGPERPSLCFDEHRTITATTYGLEGSARQRLAWWDAARAVVEKHPKPPPAPSAPAPSPWPWLAGALALGLVVGGVTRWVRNARKRRPATAASMIKLEPPKVRRLPVIDTSTCIGCSACVDVCPYDVFEIKKYVAEVVRPDDCCGLTLCEQQCPNGSLIVTDGDPVRDQPAVDGHLQALGVPGLFLAGDLTGMPLIRNAINQGAAAVQGASRWLQSQPGGRTEVDLVIVGSGPAGLSAALEAKSRGLRFVVFEQGSVAESIRSFPRGKLVFDQPLGVPLVGDLWLAESTKEELLSKWLRIVREHALPIEEATRVTSIERRNGTFVVGAQHDNGPRQVTAGAVVLAIGKRGTPRKLPTPIPTSWLDRVHYAMADARSFAGRSVLVVGLGDVAMETAIALCRQPDTTVQIAYRGDGFRRGKSRNVREIERLVRAGRLQLHWSTEVEAFSERGVTLRSAEGSVACAADAVFVMIGSIVPWAFLSAVGVQRGGAAPPNQTQLAPAPATNAHYTQTPAGALERRS